ncbi:MAG: hypothetical protein IT349_03835 [Candidatus Eisenbacteria bacterium]|nr:hypothetical protein [Candidatus Eisenbacteria bacterium]MCC7141213.1 hypothetical protein [Candidatus Eisenbacteria bacterium]
MGILTLLSVPARAGENAFQGTSLPADPTWQATSGARAATGRSAACALRNPATLVRSDQPDLSTSHLQWANGVAREWAAIRGRLGTVKLVGDAALLHAPELEGYDATGVALGRFRAGEWTAGLSFAHDLAPGWAVGLGLRTTQLQDPEASLSAFSGSAGLLVEQGSWTAGVSLSDFGVLTGANAESYGTDRRITLGIERAWGPGQLLAAALERGGDGRLATRLGGSFAPHPSFELLAGCAWSAGDEGGELGAATGLRLALRRVAISYAFQPTASLGATHQIGLELSLQRGPSIWDGIREPIAPAR